jgi:hydroxymethylpyrimidine pyrophosphatase-like HAD family hydrolase
MYNGAEIVNAENGLVVKKERNSASSLNPAFELLAENSDVTSTKTKIVQKPHSIQIQVRERSTSRLDELCRIVSTILPHRFAVRSSGYAIDIYPRGKMKDYCLRLINEHFGVRLNFIKVGDQGHKLGNDFELLSKRGGFSVGTLSTDETSCFPVVDEWGNRLLGVKGCIHLLSHTFRLL